MALDASAALAIVLGEDDADIFVQRLAREGGALITPINLWEVLVRARARRGDDGVAIAEAFLAKHGVVVVPADGDLAREAAEVFARFKGRPGGRLNLGDCFAYALAMREGDGLLFKGDDFPRTDVKSALAP